MKTICITLFLLTISNIILSKEIDGFLSYEFYDMNVKNEHNYLSCGFGNEFMSKSRYKNTSETLSSGKDTTMRVKVFDTSKTLDPNNMYYYFNINYKFLQISNRVTINTSKYKMYLGFRFPIVLKLFDHDDVISKIENHIYFTYNIKYYEHNKMLDDPNVYFNFNNIIDNEYNFKIEYINSSGECILSEDTPILKRMFTNMNISFSIGGSLSQNHTNLRMKMEFGRQFNINDLIYR